MKQILTAIVCAKPKITRNTLETQISVKLDLDGSGKSRLATGIGFFDHMLDQDGAPRHDRPGDRSPGRPALSTLTTPSRMWGITLGPGVRPRRSATRRRAPLWPCLRPARRSVVAVVVDLSGRPGLEYAVEYVRGWSGRFDIDLVHEFFQGFAITRCDFAHRQLQRQKRAPPGQTIFKALGARYAWASEMDPRRRRVAL